MTQQEYEEMVELMVEAENDIGFTKGKEYSGTEDRLANFKQEGELMCCPHCKVPLGPKMVLWMYLNKHIRSIRNYINTDKVLSEPIEERIKDCRVYLSLLRALVEEEKKCTKKK